MKLDKINLIAIGILILLVLFSFTLNKKEVVFEDNSTLNEISQIKDKIDLLEMSLENKSGDTNLQLIQIEDKENLECALVIKEYGSNSKLILYDYTGNGNLGEVGNIAIDGYEYLKTLGGSKHNIYSGVQCREDNGWTLINGKSSEYSVKEIDGELQVVKDEFIQENGYFSQRGDVQIICCKIAQ